ncbi:MAG TPA: hypothetical protein VLQ93_06650, partial [Myxococcaceae bacterium]|nr:hypothetical protein [Myxococcaceae bacterium]
MSDTFPGEEPPSPGPSGYVTPMVAWGREAVEQVGLAIQDVLEDPRLRARLPGGSLTLLGVGLVGAALLLSALPFVSGLGVFWSAVMLLGGALVAVNAWRELRTQGVRALPPVLENLPEVTRHPRIAQAYALLTCAHALMMLGFGLVPALWLLAAVVLGYEQGQRFLAGQPRRWDTFEPGEESLRFRLHPWVVAGAVLCTLALYVPWARSNLPLLGGAGREQPLATFTQLALLVLGGLAMRRRGLASVPILVPVLLTVWLTVWFFLMLNPYTPGPWLFLPGLLMLDAV